MNRYTDLSVSAYNPMTTQEIWAPAAAMRQQHNAADEKLQTQIAELDKVNPLDVHYDKAQKIKSDLIKQIENQSSALATEGFNGNTTSGVYKTNRQLHEQFSPTGELGQINAAKTAYDTEKATYLEDATKTSKIGREQALKNWEKYAKAKYTGYSEDGKKIANITALGSPAYQDYETDRNQYHALLGKITSSAKASGHAIVPDATSGLLMMVNRGGNVVHSDNIDALNNAMKGMKDKWVSETGEGRKWADAAGWDPSHTNYRINQDFNAMKEISNVDNRTENYEFLPGQSIKTKEPPSSGSQGYNLGDGKLFDANQKIMREVGLGGGGVDQFTKEERKNQGWGNAPLFKIIPDVTTKAEKSPEYKKLASSINRSLIASKKFKEGSKEEEAAVKAYLTKYGNTVIKNRIIDPFLDESGFLFADKTIGKEANAAQANLWKRVKIGASKMVDEDGNEIPLNKVTQFTYNGDLTANSNINAFKEDKRQNYLAHAGTVKIGDEIKKVYISRNSDDFNTPLYKGAVDGNKINNIIVSQPNIYHTFKSSQIKGFNRYGMKDVEIKYNEGKGTYDVSYKENDGTNIDMPFVTDEYGNAETKFNKWLIKLNE
jgi:hypothetical protein